MPPTPTPPWHPSSPPIDPDTFYDLIEGPPTIIHFWAPWNPYDRPLDDNLQPLLPAFTKHFRFLSANTDNTAFSPIVDAFHVAALPSLLCFANGKVRGRFHGLQTPEALLAFLTEMKSQPRSR